MPKISVGASFQHLSVSFSLGQSLIFRRLILLKPQVETTNWIIFLHMNMDDLYYYLDFEDCEVLQNVRNEWNGLFNELSQLKCLIFSSIFILTKKLWGYWLVSWSWMSCMRSLSVESLRCFLHWVSLQKKWKQNVMWWHLQCHLIILSKYYSYSQAYYTSIVHEEQV